MLQKKDTLLARMLHNFNERDDLNVSHLGVSKYFRDEHNQNVCIHIHPLAPGGVYYELNLDGLYTERDMNRLMDTIYTTEVVSRQDFYDTCKDFTFGQLQFEEPLIDKESENELRRALVASGALGKGSCSKYELAPKRKIFITVYPDETAAEISTDRFANVWFPLLPGKGFRISKDLLKRYSPSYQKYLNVY